MIKKNIALELRLYPNKTQKVLLNKTFGCARKVYNLALAECIESYNQTKMFNHRGYSAYKKEYPYLNEVEAQALSQSIQDLNVAFKNRFSKNVKKQSGFPKFKSKRSRQSYRTNMPSPTALQDKYVKIPVVGKVRFRAKPRVQDDWKLKSITVSRSASGKYHASLLYEYYIEEPNTKLDLDNSIGLDYASNGLYVDNQGNEPDYPRYYRLYEDKLAFEQKKLSRMKKGSNNYYKQKIKVAKVHEKIANCRKNFLHKSSYNLAETYDYVFIEDLNMQNMSKSLRLGKSTTDNGFGMFRSMLKYKLENRGKILHIIDKWDATSTVCSVCSVKHKDIVNSLSVREWVCPDCGTHHNRDINAAINIRKLGMLAYEP